MVFRAIMYPDMVQLGAVVLCSWVDYLNVCMSLSLRSAKRLLQLMMPRFGSQKSHGHMEINFFIQNLIQKVTCLGGNV